MPSQNKPAQSSPFEIITTGKSKKVGKTGIFIGITIVIFLILSVVAGVLLVRQQQNIQEKAQSLQCPGVEACPVPDQLNLLKSCHPSETDGSPTESLCNRAGRVETCGVANKEYCCPSVGGAWTRDMTACAVSPTPTATSTSNITPTPTPTPTPTGTSAGTPTPTATATGSLSSCNGTCGSNTNCQSGLYCYSGHCRNPLCASDSACSCASATTTPTPTATSAIAAGTQSAQTTSLPIPVTGTDWPTFAGVGMGIMAILVSILLAL